MVADALKEIIEPHMGTVMSDTCIRAAAISIGKTYDDLMPQDIPRIKLKIRDSLRVLTAPQTVDTIMQEIEFIGGGFL